MKLSQKFLDWVIYGNIWIAICAAACGYMGEFMYSYPTSPQLLCLLFCATSLRYNLIGFTVTKHVSSSQFVFAWKHRHALQVLAVASGLGVAVSMLFLQWLEIVFLAHLGILSLWYVFPFPKVSGSLRRKPYLKIFLIAYVWACSTWLLPYIHATPAPTISWAVLGSFVERFLFFFAITLPFDIRDMIADEQALVQTIPRKIGVKNTQWLITALLLLTQILAYLLYPISTFMGMLPASVLALVLSWRAQSAKHDYYFLGWLDGTMLLQAIGVWIAHAF